MHFLVDAPTGARPHLRTPLLIYAPTYVHPYLSTPSVVRALGCGRPYLYSSLLARVRHCGLSNVCMIFLAYTLPSLYVPASVHPHLCTPLLVHAVLMHARHCAHPCLCTFLLALAGAHPY